MAEKKLETLRIPDKFYYQVGIDDKCIWDYDCEAYGCDDEGICRCGSIIKSSVSVNREYLFEDLAGDSGNIRAYCYDRLFMHHGLYDPLNYEVETTGGYYGEEVNGIFFNNKDELNDDLDRFQGLTDDVHRLNFTLSREYATEIKWGDPKIVEVPVYLLKSSDTMFKYRGEQYKPIDGLPIGVYRETGGYYTVVDGHHRLSFILKNKTSTDIVKIIVTNELIAE